MDKSEKVSVKVRDTMLIEKSGKDEKGYNTYTARPTKEVSIMIISDDVTSVTIPPPNKFDFENPYKSIEVEIDEGNHKKNKKRKRRNKK